jgi:hypothetical protein
LNFTPFPYLLFFPVSVYLGQVKGRGPVAGLGIQAGWTWLFFYLLARWCGGAASANIRRWEDDKWLNLPIVSGRLRRYAIHLLRALVAQLRRAGNEFQEQFSAVDRGRGLWFALQLSFIGVIYLHTDHIATWTKWQVVMLVGASHFIQQIFQAFFLTNCTSFPS